MSGGVGPAGDIALPREEAEVPNAGVKATGKLTPACRSFFTLGQLNALAVAVVLSASGMVSLQDLAFVLFSMFYMYFISRVAFPPTSPHPDPPLYGGKNRILSLYALAGAVIGLFLPIAYIFEGIFEGDKEGIKAAAPHVFLLANQIFMEGVCCSGRFSLPVRALVPVFYNSMRILTIMDWVRSEISKLDVGGSSEIRVYIGKALAVVNMAFWSFNLFGFLLPFYFPKAFKTYYSNSKVRD